MKKLNEILEALEKLAFIAFLAGCLYLGYKVYVMLPGILGAIND